MGLETNLSRDFKPCYALTPCWYQLSRVNGKLGYLDVGIKAYEAYLRKIGMHTYMTPMHNT